ncbi:hypothetical protein ACI1MP_03385 [Kitasatospora griseola]|uniref:hypothetical protein n=1 Tax=Kitasatospora griseola TaxID=2064 RepID=UPI00385578A7
MLARAGPLHARPPAWPSLIRGQPIVTTGSGQKGPGTFGQFQYPTSPLVRDEREREAVDRVTALQFDRHGSRVWCQVQGLLDSEHVRRAIGEIATAYGVCKEPSNVAAGGHACPLRFHCLGCEHFQTDVSYLPDPERYLADLLRSREKLMSAFEADDWARSEAMPSEEEIHRVRRLISRVRADLAGLTAEDRARIEEAVAVVRRGRTVLLGMPQPRVQHGLLDARPWTSV